MATEGGALVFSVASVVEDVLQQHGNRSRDLDLDARRAEEAGNFFLLLIFPFYFSTNLRNSRSQFSSKFSFWLVRLSIKQILCKIFRMNVSLKIG